MQAFLAAGGHAPLWIYVLLLAATATPLVPNASLVVASGALSAQGRMSLVPVVLTVLCGLLCGDLVLYGAARGFWRRGRRPRDVGVRPGRLARILGLAERAAVRLPRDGTAALVTLRTVPGGRSTGALAAGLSGYPSRRYAFAALLAESSWTTTTLLIGYTGGALVSGPIPAVVAGLCLCGSVNLVRLVIRHLRRRRPEPA
jgi:membrane protein DedA with SNARE-associated domain